jgi:hypothetical protein
MKYYLKLAEHLFMCPQCWQGFVKSLDHVESPELDFDGGYSTAFINKHLTPHHAEFTDLVEDISAYVTFETEADAIVFKLKYG